MRITTTKLFEASSIEHNAVTSVVQITETQVIEYAGLLKCVYVK